MSGIPPQLDTSTGTPAPEWAAQTTSALRHPDDLDTPPASSVMNPTTAQLFEEKNMRPGTVPASTTAAQTQQQPSLASALTGEGHSAVSTPGQELPGAFPRAHQAELAPEQPNEAFNGISATASRMAQSVGSAAQQYLPAAAQYLPKSVVEGVKPYIPALNAQGGTVIASEHDHPHRVSLPSTELTGAAEHERTEGVGALPGAVGESDVTELPDQREGFQLPTAEGATAIAGATAAGAMAGVGFAAERAKNTAADYAPTSLTGTSNTTSLPSQEPFGAQPYEHSSGAGALPGKFSETGVAALPDESANTRNATSSAVGTHPRMYGSDVAGASLPTREAEFEKEQGVSGGAGALPGGAGEGGVAILPDQRQSSSPGMSGLEAAELGAVGAGAGIAGVGAGVGMGKWEHEDKPQMGESGLREGVKPNAGLTPEKQRTHAFKDPKIGESEVMAERARRAGAEKAREMSTSGQGERKEHAGAWDAGVVGAGATAGTKATQGVKEQKQPPVVQEEHAGAWDSGVDSGAPTKETQGAYDTSDGGDMRKDGPDHKKEAEIGTAGGAAAVGAAVGAGVAKDREEKSQQKEDVKEEKREAKEEKKEEKKEKKQSGGQSGKPNKAGGGHGSRVRVRRVIDNVQVPGRRALSVGDVPSRVVQTSRVAGSDVDGDEDENGDRISLCRGDETSPPHDETAPSHHHDETSTRSDASASNADKRRADLRHPTLRPRTHVLGEPGAVWGGVEVGGEGYKRGKGVDIGMRRARDSDEGAGYDTDYHPSQLHPAEGDYSKEHQEHADEEKTKEPAAEKDGEGKPLTGATHADSKQGSHAEGTGSATEHDEPPSPSSPSSASQKGQKTKKAGFMAKMKGEALVLLGKVEGKKGHEKVEEGQRIKQGLPKSGEAQEAQGEQKQ